MSEKCPQCNQGNQSHKEIFEGLTLTYYFCGHRKIVVVVNETITIKENAELYLNKTEEELYQQLGGIYKPGSALTATIIDTLTQTHTERHRHTQTHKHTHTDTHTDTQTLTHRHRHTHTQRHTNTQTQTHTQRHTQTHTHITTNTHTHTDTYTHRHTHTHTDTHTYRDTQTHRHTQTHTQEYYSAAKKNETLPFATTWMGLKSVILSEISQRKTNILYHLYVESKK